MSTGMITNTNLFSLSSLVSAGRNQGDLSKSINRLSSGLRINTFMDDPSRMEISEKMRYELQVPPGAFHIVTAAELNENKNQQYIYHQ